MVAHDADALHGPAGLGRGRYTGRPNSCWIALDMDAHQAVTAKVEAIFKELAGARAESLRGGKPARKANDILGQALAPDHDLRVAGEMAFHLVDWNSDAAFLVAFMLFPERFTAEELQAGVDMFMVHVPAHILAAARLGDYEAKDIFIEE